MLIFINDGQVAIIMSRICCLPVSVRAGAIVASVLGVLGGAGFGVIYAVQIDSGMMGTPHNLPAASFVPFVSMGSWVAFALISFYGCVATWLARPRLATTYFWVFLAHYIIDLGFLAVTLFFCIKGSESAIYTCPPNTVPAARTAEGEALCKMPLTAANISVLVALVVYKLFSTFVVYLLFLFRRWAHRQALEKEAQRIMQQRPPQQWINYDADTTKNWSKFDD